MSKIDIKINKKERGIPEKEEILLASYIKTQAIEKNKEFYGKLKQDDNLSKKEQELLDSVYSGRGRPKKDNVQLNMRYPRILDELIRAEAWIVGQGNPSDVIVPILMQHYGLIDE